MSEVLDVAADASDGAKAAWQVLAAAPLPEGWRRELTTTGFDDHDLRFYREGDWMFSAVLNHDWVLWYARRPALRAGLPDRAAMLARFPAARWKDKGEVKLRLHDGAEAQALWDWTMTGA